MYGIQNYGVGNGNNEVYKTGRQENKPGRNRKNGREEAAASVEFSDQAKGVSPEDLKKTQTRANGLSLEKNQKTSKEDGLSEKAKSLLAKLREKYGDMDFYVTDFATDEEAAAYHRQSTKKFSCVIDPETLEEMASDETVKEKYLSVIDGAEGEFEQMKTELGEDAKEVERFGINVDKDGVVTYFAELRKSTANNQKQMLAARKAEKARNAEQAAKKEKKKERETVTGSSVKELTEKIKELLENRKEKIAEDETITENTLPADQKKDEAPKIHIDTEL